LAQNGPACDEVTLAALKKGLRDYPGKSEFAQYVSGPSGRSQQVLDTIADYRPTSWAYDIGPLGDKYWQSALFDSHEGGIEDGNRRRFGAGFYADFTWLLAVRCHNAENNGLSPGTLESPTQNEKGTIVGRLMRVSGQFILLREQSEPQTEILPSR
jgi:hypothetical protein